MLDKILSFIANIIGRKDAVIETTTYMLNRAPVRKRCGIVTLYMTALQSLPQGSEKTIAQLPSGWDNNLSADITIPERGWAAC